MEYLGLWILMAMTLNMWGAISVVLARPNLVTALLWLALLSLLPGVGFIAWTLFGPRAGS